MQQALSEAKLNKDDIDYINAHGLPLLQVIRPETDAIKNALGLEIAKKRLLALQNP